VKRATVVWMVAALAVAAIALSAALAPSGARTTASPAGPQEWRGYRSRDAGFLMHYPRGWHLTPVHTSCGTVDFLGAIVSNAGAAWAPPKEGSGTCWAPDTSALPPDVRSCR
jgi:hypothetical protein